MNSDSFRAPRGRALLGLAVLLLFAAPSSAEEIRIEVSRGKAAASVSDVGPGATQGSDATPAPLGKGESHQLAAKGEQLSIDGRAVRAPLVLQGGKAAMRFEGKALGGRLEIWAEKGALVVVNALDLEEYVAAVVSSEMPSRWPLAALEAQAVAARTYAVAQKIASGPAARAHLGASVLDQVYAGAASPAAREAARATFGEVLTWEAAPIAAFFSASCGGKSESAEAAFDQAPGSAPYLTSADDGDADAAMPGLSWTVKLPLAQLSKKLSAAKRAGEPIAEVKISAVTPSGRAKEIRLVTKSGASIALRASELRQLVGYTRLPSLAFTVEVSGGQAIFRGRGSGHGVGLCQWGARGRALGGAGYRDILAHYYPGAEIRRMY